MTSPFMDAYVQLLIKTCHKRGVHAMGGMAAQIPIKNDPAANEAALAKVCLCGWGGGGLFALTVNAMQQNAWLAAGCCVT
jgi:hypothetical protein